MSANGAAALYTPELLGLAVELARFPFDPKASCQGQASSRTCGSRIDLSLDLEPNASIKAAGLRVSACAIGQAAAAIFAEQAGGHDKATLAATLVEIEHWLDGGDLPDWPGFAALAAARDHKGRHGAILLPWRAALEALSNA